MMPVLISHGGLCSACLSGHGIAVELMLVFNVLDLLNVDLDLGPMRLLELLHL